MARVQRKTPAQQQRAKLTTAIRARGERGTNIWQVRPPFEDRDLNLSSDPQYETFYVIEGEPRFSEIRYLAQWYEVDPEPSLVAPSRQFAVVTTVDQQELSIELAFGSDFPSGAQAKALIPINGSIRINLHVLNNHVQRVTNWRQVIAFIRRVRLHSTEPIEQQIAVVLHRIGPSTVRDLVAKLSDVDAGLFYGALATCLRRRELQSDLDTRPWSLNTRIWNAPI